LRGNPLRNADQYQINARHEVRTIFMARTNPACLITDVA